MLVARIVTVVTPTPRWTQGSGTSDRRACGCLKERENIRCPDAEGELGTLEVRTRVRTEYARVVPPSIRLPLGEQTCQQVFGAWEPPGRRGEAPVRGDVSRSPRNADGILCGAIALGFILGLETRVCRYVRPIVSLAGNIQPVNWRSATGRATSRTATPSATAPISVVESRELAGAFIHRLDPPKLRYCCFRYSHASRRIGAR